MLKKILKGAAAAAVSMTIAAQAHAAEWEISVGGYAEQFIAYGTADYSSNITNAPDREGVDANFEGEFHVRPSITLDNGIKIEARMDFEGMADDNGRGNDLDIDEPHIRISGSFGSILIGSTESAGSKMHFSAPNPNLITNDDIFSGDLDSGFGPNYNFNTFVASQSPVIQEFQGDNLYRNPLGTTRLENEGFNEGTGISYFTPRFAGFQLGVSYARDGARDEGRSDCNYNICNYFDIGANYVESFGDFKIAASARWGTASAPDSWSGITGVNGIGDPEVLSFGMNIGYGGFTIGGSWAEQSGTGYGDGDSYDVGATYDTGPWTFSLNYLHGENAYSGGTSPYNFNGEINNDIFNVGLDYELDEGVRLNLFGAYVDYDEAYSSGGSSSSFGGDGFVIGTGIGLSF